MTNCRHCTKKYRIGSWKWSAWFCKDCATKAVYVQASPARLEIEGKAY